MLTFFGSFLFFLSPLLMSPFSLFPSEMSIVSEVITSFLEGEGFKKNIVVKYCKKKYVFTYNTKFMLHITSNLNHF